MNEDLKVSALHPIEETKQQHFAMRIYILPNLMTTGNLFCGFYAIIHAIQGDYVKAAYWICGASVFDFLDGRLARLTRATSKFGAEYDSLSDLVSFCVAPAIMLYLWGLQPFGRVGWLGSFLFVTCGALRLARFNVQANVIKKTTFRGCRLRWQQESWPLRCWHFRSLRWKPGAISAFW